MTLYEGYEFYKSVQGTKYDVNDLEKKEKLQEFRNNLGNFTDKIFKDRHSLLALEKGMWQNSGNFCRTIEKGKGLRIAVYTISPCFYLVPEVGIEPT